jgi:hypothetical protein
MKKSQNKANKAQTRAQNNNQPNHNCGYLPCKGRQLLNAAMEPPNPFFEDAEVVKNGKVKFVVNAHCKEMKRFSR